MLPASSTQYLVRLVKALMGPKLLSWLWLRFRLCSCCSCSMPSQLESSLNATFSCLREVKVSR